MEDHHEIEWREAYGLPIRYCLTHGQDYHLCTEREDD